MKFEMSTLTLELGGTFRVLGISTSGTLHVAVNTTA